MIAVKDFQVIRYKCGKKYCPGDWTIELWDAFYGDCFRIVAENKQDDEEWMDSLYKCYDVPKELVENVTAFIKENIDAFKENIG